jgi:hypothetical protein
MSACPLQDVGARTFAVNHDYVFVKVGHVQNRELVGASWGRAGWGRGTRGTSREDLCLRRCHLVRLRAIKGRCGVKSSSACSPARNLVPSFCVARRVLVRRRDDGRSRGTTGFRRQSKKGHD